MSAALRPVMYTMNPAWQSSCVTPFPTPRLAPVTTATRFCIHSLLTHHPYIQKVLGSVKQNGYIFDSGKRNSPRQQHPQISNIVSRRPGLDRITQFFKQWKRIEAAEVRSNVQPRSLRALQGRAVG